MGKPRDVSEAWRKASYRSIFFRGSHGMTLADAPPPVAVIYCEGAGPVPPWVVPTLLGAAEQALRENGSLVILCTHRDRRDHAKRIVDAAMPPPRAQGSAAH